MAKAKRRQLSKSKKSILVVGFSFLLSLAIIEIAARVFYNPLFKRIRTIVYVQPSKANPDFVYFFDCYPSDPHGDFPIDFRKEGIKQIILQKTRQAAKDGVKLAGSFGTEEYSPNGEVFLPLDGAIDILARTTPHCVFHDTTDGTDRMDFSGDNPGETIALLGDSFAWGQGVPASQTFAWYLSRMSNVRIINYGRIGHDILNIFSQFKKAMKEHQRFKFKKLIYLFVLNDPLKTQRLKDEHQYIDDFMNMRWDFTRKSNFATPLVMNLMAVSKHSYLLKLVFDRYVLWSTRNKTIKWYRNTFSYEKNDRLEETFRLISLMADRAKQEGIDFHLVIYPLMVDFKSYPFRKAHQVVKDFSKHPNINFIDLLPAFQKSSETRFQVHEIDYHPNGRAHKVAAEETSRILGKRRQSGE